MHFLHFLLWAAAKQGGTTTGYQRRARPDPLRFDQGIRRRLVIVGDEGAGVLLFRGRVMEGQIRPGQPDAVNLPMKHSLQRFFDLVERELDAR